MKFTFSIGGDCCHVDGTAVRTRGISIVAQLVLRTITFLAISSGADGGKMSVITTRLDPTWGLKLTGIVIIWGLSSDAVVVPTPVADTVLFHYLEFLFLWQAFELVASLQKVCVCVGV